MDRHPLHPKPLTVEQFARNCSEISAEMRTMADAISVTPISADLLRIRAVVEQRKPRLTLAELAELEKTHRALTLKLADYRQSAFSLIDLHNAVRDAGYEIDDYGGDPAVFFAPTPSDKTEFVIDLAQACPRYAHVIMRAARWSDGACCFWWCARELREAP
jgi:hypothetical protein